MYVSAIYLLSYLGVGGNLVAVHASRLSTSLHRRATLGELPKDAVHGCPNLIDTYFGKGEDNVVLLEAMRYSGK